MSVAHVLLRLLLEGPAHGYDLRRRLGAFGAFYPLTNVNVYPTLKDLEERGWVCSRSEIANSRMRKIYEIAADGVAEFERWSSEPPEMSVSAETDLIALKLAVVSSRQGTGVDWLPQSLVEIDEAIATWRASLEAAREGMPRLAQLTAEYRLVSLEHRRAYLYDAIQIPALSIGVTAARVLVADDSAGSRALSNHLLAAAGYDVELAEDGARAWERLQVGCFDVAVLDALMPEPNGFELLRRIRASSDLADLPVVLNTSLGESDERAPLASGANAYVCKTREDAGRQLVDCVDELLDKVTHPAARG
jgi:CheY-like chemotaxis protein